MDKPVDNRILWLWLSLVCGPASSVAETLLDHFGTVEAVFAAEEDALSEVPGLRAASVKKLSNKDLTEAKEINAYCLNEGVGIVTPDSPLYPARLSRIQRRPIVLYYKGILTDLENEVCVAAVGTRTMTEYGSRAAYSTAYELAKAGAVVVSGMAKGVDGMAHRGALDAGGYTVAVLGCGIDRIYPAEHADLMAQIVRNGLVLTEYKPFTEPKGGNFPLRNRIISGLSQATLVVEAPAGSGALITAKTALEQGRDVFALPGKVGEFNSVGTNELIRDGARIVTSAADILLEYQPLYEGKINLNRLTNLRSVKFRSPVRQAAAPQPFTVTDRRIVDALEEAVADAEAAIAARDARESEETTPEAVGAPSEPAKATKAPSKPKKAAKDKAPAKPKKSLFSGFGRKGTPPDETVAPTPPKDYSTYPEGQQKLLTLLAEGKKTADQLAAQTGMPVGDVLCELTMLEIGGEIGALPGGFYETV